MKYLVRVFLFNVFGLWLVSQILPTLTVAGNWITIITAGFALSVLMLFVRPVLQILFIPINIITFGLLSWLVNVIVLFLLTVFMPEVTVRAWNFPGWTGNGFALPATYIPYPIALIISSFAITLFTNILHDMSES